MSDTPTPHRVTQRQIAEAAGVALSTVSLALRDDRRISKEVRDEINSLAEKMGYRSNPLVRAWLHSCRHGTQTSGIQIAFLNDYEEANQYSEYPLFRDYWRGAKSAASALGYIINLFWTREPGMDWGRLERIFKARNVRGIILPPVGDIDRNVELDFDNYSTIAIGHSLPKPNLNRVCHDQWGGAEKAYFRLKDHGFRRIGLVLQEEIDQRTDFEISGWFYRTRTMLANESDWVEPWIVPTSSYSEMAFKEWLDSKQPDVVVCEAQKVIDYLHKYNAQSSKKVSSLMLATAVPENASQPGYYQNAFLVGSHAVERVARAIEQNITGQTDVPTELRVPPLWSGKLS